MLSGSFALVFLHQKNHCVNAADHHENNPRQEKQKNPWNGYVSIRAVAKLQDGLGAFNDTASATHHLRDVEAAANPQAAKAAGIVLGWCGRGAVNADDELRQAWKSFKRTRPFWH
jgi:hypothetical protein